MGTRVVQLLRLRGVPILQQLRIEEAILRASNQNWCILNSEICQPAVVMGLSGKMEEHLHTSQVREMGIPVIKRFSGGGTVVVDEGTVFATLVFQADCVPDVECYPKPVMRWTEDLYGPVFLPFGNFELHEQDYTFGSLKFGGNAQAITKQRWLHHTSFLWNYNENLMALLKAPERQPAYRQKRSHEEFLCRLKDHMPSKTGLMDGICAALERKGYVLQDFDVDEVPRLLAKDHLTSTRVIDLS